jgi:uncharacterized membrane protein
MRRYLIVVMFFAIFCKILFIILDVIEHRKRGFKLNGVWVALGFFWHIIYLFVRAKRTNKKYEYAIIGVVLEVFSSILNLTS